YGAKAEYGAFGLCPIGSPDGGETSLTEIYADGVSPTFPYCSDEAPEIRHFCLPPDTQPYQLLDLERTKQIGGQCPESPGTNELASGLFATGFGPASKDAEYNCLPSNDLIDPDLPEDDVPEIYNLRRGSYYDVDIGTWTGSAPDDPGSDCNPLYDVDDYARDWADYVGLSRGSAGDEQLPTMFAIGFGLNFPVGSSGDPGSAGYVPGSTAANIPDYLGEELLRYIADVGDNFEIDTDHQQDWRDNGVDDNSIEDADSTEVYGVRGPCESPTIPAGEPNPWYEPLKQRQNCGNYYNAPNQAQLQIVFDDIASRMFTRLSG
ncbi:MAG: hypothetical protein H7Y11_12755, partial [Armatimonadetes bacterium]|nr:hypothetical protein [Anaerolineae bacterium]